ncbi:hypothetical protein [Sphingomonas sp. UYEF23]|uniref:JAB domain-containing protein n=1 Tax=Sphingomonas sp. UYEF23 TaxID=1756408 RepID=UPI003395222B
MNAPLPDHAGHRARLRQRLIEQGGDGLLDYELVEYLLMLAVPRRDTKPLAKALIAEFGGFGGVFSADAAAPMRVPGMGETTAAAIKIVQAAALRLLQVEAKAQPVLASWQALIDYLHADMAHRGTERVRVLHLNKCKLVVSALPSHAARYRVSRLSGEKADWQKSPTSGHCVWGYGRSNAQDHFPDCCLFDRRVGFAREDDRYDRRMLSPPQWP